MQNKAIFYFHFDIFIFENKVARIGGGGFGGGEEMFVMQLDGQLALCPAAMECHV